MGEAAQLCFIRNVHSKINLDVSFPFWFDFYIRHKRLTCFFDCHLDGIRLTQFECRVIIEKICHYFDVWQILGKIGAEIFFIISAEGSGAETKTCF